MTPQQIAESLSLINSDCAYVQLPARTLIEVGGEDRTRFLHNVCTNDINRLTPGQGCEAFFTTVQGKTLLHAFIYCEENSHIIDASPNQAEALLPHLTKYALIDDVVLSDRAAGWKQWLLLGASAPAILEKLGLPAPDGMLTFSHQANVTVRRVPTARVPAFIMQVKTDADQSALQTKLDESDIRAIDYASVLAAQIEAGFPEFGVDVTVENLPQEVDRDEQAISFTKGCYLGQETVARIDAVGHVNKYLVRLESEFDLNPGDELYASANPDKAVGKITSAVRLPDRSLALGYLRREPKESGEPIQSTQGSVTVRVTTKA